MLKIFNVS